MNQLLSLLCSLAGFILGMAAFILILIPTTKSPSLQKGFLIPEVKKVQESNYYSMGTLELTVDGRSS
jgi:hypothetical protein